MKNAAGSRCTISIPTGGSWDSPGKWQTSTQSPTRASCVWRQGGVLRRFPANAPATKRYSNSRLLRIGSLSREIVSNQLANAVSSFRALSQAHYKADLLSPPSIQVGACSPSTDQRLERGVEPPPWLRWSQLSRHDRVAVELP